MFTNIQSSTDHTEETRDGQRPHPPSPFSSHSGTTQDSAHRRPLVAPLQVPYIGRGGRMQQRGRIRLTNMFFRVILITRSRPWANEGVNHQRQKRGKERKEERQDTLHYHITLYDKAQDYTVFVESVCYSKTRCLF